MDRAVHTHETLVRQRSVSSEMEEDGHVVAVVRGIESSNIDQGVSLTVPEVVRIESRLPAVIQIYRVALCVCRQYCSSGGCSERSSREAEGSEE